MANERSSIWMPKGLNRRTSVAALDLEKIEDLAAKGLTLEQIAAALNIDVRTLYNHRKKFREVGEAINRGAANGIATIANKLFEAANNGNVTAQIFFLKARAGWRDQGPAVEINSQQNVHVAPDPAALEADRNLIREAIQILRSHGVPAAVELEETEFRKLPDPDRSDES
jgi:AcrR family transcriptional regulator